ncbi:MAG: hypothetical protein MZV70_71075 [Desulfobacterales bacterium]|nr:hypothetical protein [Desulfobacterales bacterium]
MERPDEDERKLERRRGRRDEEEARGDTDKLARLVVADTDVVIDFFTDAAPRAQAVAELLTEKRLAIAAITVFELYAGVRGPRG